MSAQGKMKFQVSLLILLVFVLGGVTGVAIDRLALRADSRFAASARRGGPGRMIDEMKKNLNLTAEQETKVRAIFDESRKEFKELGEKAGFKEARERSRARIRATLNAEQQKQFDEMNAQHDAEVKKREGAERK